MKGPLSALAKGGLGPDDNDSRFLLDPHRRGLPGRSSMHIHPDDEEVDLVIVGAGAGGTTLAQRLARRGWRIVIFESGPFWDPDRDWVSDEAGSHRLYWTEPRVTGGEDPVELGKNNSGHGVGGSMVHFAGFTPRFHPSDFDVSSREGVAADWPISYRDLKPHYERIEAELPVSGQDWPWGDPHRYPYNAHPISGGAEHALGAARAAGIEMRIGPVGIANGAFGNRPHCIYRGFCLQGCKVNAKASPLITHLPDAIAHGVEVRADSHVMRIETESGRCTGVTYRHGGEDRFQRAAAVAVAGYSIETPRLLLNSASPAALRGSRQRSGSGRPLRDGAGGAAGGGPLPRNDADVQGAAAGDFVGAVLRDGPRPRLRPGLLDPDGWAAADRLGGARARRRSLGPTMREYMRDYNHWARWAFSTSCCRSQTTASPSLTKRMHGGCRSHEWTTASATTIAPTSPTRSAFSSGSGRRRAPRTR